MTARQKPLRRRSLMNVLPLLAATACTGAIVRSLPDSAKEGAAEGSYLAQHLRCVEEYKDKPIEFEQTCRAGVRRRWCVDDAGHVGCKDAGGDQ